MDKLEFETIQNKIDIDAPKCKECNGPIFYYDSSITKSNKYKGKSYKTHKKVFDTVYNLVVCQECVEIKFPEYSLKNKSKVFNTCNIISQYAFNIPADIVKSFNKYNTMTLENSIRKYGIENGTIKWNEYKRKQAYSCSLEYFIEKYGANGEYKWKQYNSSRAVTKENMINRHGIEDGTIKWNNYINRQAYTNKIEYFIEKFGEIEGKIQYELVCSKKKLNLATFERKYGEEIGLIKYNEYIDRLSNNAFFIAGYSKSGSLFFETLERLLYKNNIDLELIYSPKTKEKGFYLKKLGKFCYLDCFMPQLNLAVEYNGNIFHANPKIYSPDDVPFPWLSSKTSKEIWESDYNRILSLKEEHNIDTLIVWEDEHKDPNKILELLNIIKEKMYARNI